MVNTPAATLIQLARERDRKKEEFKEAVDRFEGKVEELETMEPPLRTVPAMEE